MCSNCAIFLSFSVHLWLFLSITVHLDFWIFSLIFALKNRNPSSINTIYRRGIFLWAMAGSNCRPLPCEDSVLRGAILKVCYNSATLLSISVHLCPFKLNNMSFWYTQISPIVLRHVFGTK